MVVSARQTLIVAWTAAILGCTGLACLVAHAEPPTTAQSPRITPEQLDALIAPQSSPSPLDNDAAEALFLRRVSFDLIGRPPTLAEQQQFANDRAPNRRRDAIERLLAEDAFGVNWANYWRDTMAYHTPPPELTYLNYGPLDHWLAGQFNGNKPWNETVHELLIAKGKIADQPAATFIGYHQAVATNLAAETSRIFLGQQLLCAECHDHPFDHWKRTQFHELAAFFACTKSKLAQNDGAGTVVSSADKGEYLMPDMDPRKKGSPLQPVFLNGQKLDADQADDARRAQLAALVTSKDNPWFAKAYTNRIWARLMGRGFYEPVDDLGEMRPQSLPAVHEALAQHFAAADFDVKDLFRLIANTAAYQKGGLLETLEPADSKTSDPAPPPPPRLRGDEVFSALAVGVELPNVTPPKVEPTAAIRFPPPPKSTRDLVNDAFGSDPSLAPADAPRTISQALWLMNNEQLQRQINAAAGSGTMLAKLLQEQPDDQLAFQLLVRRVYSRSATAEEVRIALAHIAKIGDRRAAFEDLLWSLVNSAEFSTRR